MNYNGFSESLKKNDIKNCYIFHGEEEYIKRKQFERLRKLVLQPSDFADMNENILEDPTPEEVIDACETLPFMANKRLVIVRNSKMLLASQKSEDEGENAAGEDKPAKQDKTDLTEYIGNLPPFVCLVFYVKGKAASNKKLFRACQKNAVIVDYNKLTPLEASENVCKNIHSRGGKIDKNTAQLLVFTVGCDFGLLDQEMEKLLAYVGKDREITAEDIQTISTPTTECTVFEAVDAQVAGDLYKALRLFDNVKKNGEDDLFILSMLLRQYRILYHMRCLMDEKVSPSQQAALLGMPGFIAERTRNQAMRYTKEKLRLAYDDLLNTEYRIKQGKLPAENCAAISILRLNALMKNETGASEEML